MATKKTIAIDGPAGSGKSTVAKMVAQRLAILYLDSGAFYRAVTLTFLRNNVDPPYTIAKIENLLSQTEIQLKQFNASVKVYVNSEDVTTEIRSKEVTDSVSQVSENALVRNIITTKLRELAKSESVVMDGRDIGTVVFPNADLKIYLIATAEERAKRRFLELTNNGIKADLKDVTQSIMKRDKIDASREIAPLEQADDAILLDTTGMTIAAVVNYIYKETNKILK